MPTVANPAAPGKYFATSGTRPEKMPSAARSQTRVPAIAATWCLTARPSPTPIAVHSTVATTRRPTISAIAPVDHVISTPLATRSGTPIANVIAIAASESATPPPAVATSFAPSTRRRTGLASSVGTIEPYRNSSVNERRPSSSPNSGAIVSDTCRNACCSSGADRAPGRPSVTIATTPSATTATRPASIA